jgi:hypothetical protein
VHTIENIRSRLETLDISFSFQGINASLEYDFKYFYNKKYENKNISFSLTTICGGRNDISQYFETNSTNSTTSFNTTTTQSGQENTTDENSILGINWNALAYDLLLYNVSDMCNETYQMSASSVTQTVSVNRTCRCVLFDQVFSSNSNLQDFATLLRPLLYGKIYYHPSNTAYDNLIKRMNQTFESLDELVTLFRQIQSFIQPAYQIVLSLCNLYSFSICQQFDSYQTPLALFTILTEFIACTEMNRFVPTDSEADMVSIGQNDSVTNTFLAGIEFLNDISDTDSLPKHLQYKIRMSLDYVDTTSQTQDR